MALTRKKKVLFLLLYVILIGICLSMLVSYFKDPMRFCIFDRNCIAVQNSKADCMHVGGEMTAINFYFYEN